MRRFVPVVVAAILLAGILSDPYTYARDGSDYVRTAPVWQLSFAILDIGVLLAIVAFSIRGKSRGAFWLLVVESAYYVAGNAVLYMRDGAERFSHGFGAQSNLAEHAIVLTLRLGLILYLSSKPGSRFLGRLTSA